MVLEAIGNQTLLDGVGRRRSYWDARNASIKETYRILEMQDENRTPGYESLVVSDLLAGFKIAVHILSSNPPRHRIPVTIVDEGQRAKASKAERLISGAWRVNTSRRRNAGKLPFQNELASWMLSTGWYAAFAHVRLLEDGRPDFVADLWDVAEVFPEWGGLDDGLVACDHTYKTSLGELRRRAARYGWELQGLEGADSITVSMTDHWEKRYNPASPNSPDVLNAILLSEGRIIKPLERVDMKTIPILVGPVGGFPTSSSFYSDDRKAAARHGQSIFEAPKEVYRAANRLWGYLLENARDTIIRTYVHQSQGAQGGVTEKDISEAQRNIINLDLRETLAELAKNTSGISAGHAMLTEINAMMQRAFVPWTQFGQAPFELSGVAIERLNEQAKAVLGPALRELQAVYSTIDYLWLSEWRRLTENGEKRSSVRLAGRDRSVEGGYYDEEFTPEDIPETSWVDVTLTPSLPMDMVVKANTARIMYPQGNLLDRERVLDKVLDEDDPGLVERRIAEEEIFNTPAWKAVNVVRRMREKMREADSAGDAFEAALWQQAIEQVMVAMTQPQGEGIPPRPGINPMAAAQPSGNGRPAPLLSSGRVVRPGPEAPPLERMTQ